MDVKVTNVTASREIKTNVGNYESYGIFDSVTYAVTGEVDMIELAEIAKSDLDELQSAELNQVYDILIRRDMQKGLAIAIVEFDNDEIRA